MKITALLVTHVGALNLACHQMTFKMALPWLSLDPHRGRIGAMYGTDAWGGQPALNPWILEKERHSSLGPKLVSNCSSHGKAVGKKKKKRLQPVYNQPKKKAHHSVLLHSPGREVIYSCWKKWRRGRGMEANFLMFLRGQFVEWPECRRRENGFLTQGCKCWMKY